MGGLKLLLTLKLTCERLIECFLFTLDYATRASPRWWRDGIDHAGVLSRGGDAFKALGICPSNAYSPSAFRLFGGKKGNWGELSAKL